MSALFIICASSLLAAADSDGPIRWRNDYATAYQEAKSQNKLLLINIHTSWCMPCRQLQQTTLRDRKLAQAIMTHCVPLSLDGDENAELVQRLGVRSYPTQLFVSPDGRIVGRIESFVDPAKYAQVMETSLSRAGTQKMVAQNPAPKPQPAAQPTNQVTATPKPPVVAATEASAIRRGPLPTADIDSRVQPCSADVPLALEGYCPVSMITKAELIEGDSSICVAFEGKRYVFHSERERELFAKNPRQYLPAADGVCLVTLMETGRTKLGAIDYPAIFEDQVYFFADASQRRKFLGDPEKYVHAYQEQTASRQTATLR